MTDHADHAEHADHATPKQARRAYLAAQRAERRVAASTPASPSPGLPDPTTWIEKGVVAKVRRDEAEAELRQIKLQVQRGELVRLDDVRRHLAEVCSHLRASLLGDIPRRIAQGVSGQTVKDAERTVRRELRDLLTTWAETATRTSLASQVSPGRGQRPSRRKAG